MAIFEAAVLALIALVVTPGWLFYFDVTPKVALLLAGAAVLLLGSRRFAWRGWFPALLLLNALSLALSTAFSRNPALSMYGTSWRKFGLVTQVAVFLFAFLSGRSPKITLRGITIASAIAALYGIAQYAGWDPLLPASAYHIGEGLWTIVRPPGTLGYAAYFANWLAMAAFLAVVLARMEEHAMWRRFASAAAALCAAATILTGTRAGILALLCGAVFLAWRRISVSRAMIVSAVLIAIFAAFYFSPAGWPLRSRTRWFIEDPWGGARTMLWRDSLHMAASRLAVGNGPEVFTAAFPAYESKQLAEAYPDFSLESPHNIFLDALVSQGVVGFLLLAALCYCGFRYGDRQFLPALAAGVVAHQFAAFIAPTALLFFIILALSAQRTWEPEPSRLLLLPRAAVAFALVFVAFHLAVADHALALTSRSLMAGDLPAAMQHYRKYERWRLPGSAADLWYSRSLAAMMSNLPNPLVRTRAFAEAITAGERATSTAEDPFNAWYSLSALQAVTNDAAGVESSLQRAIAARPNWFKPHWALARLLYLENRGPEARAEAALALELNHGHDPEVTRSLQK
jgi:O-antigen ligase